MREIDINVGDKTAFQRWLSEQPKHIQSNCKIVSADEVGQDYMLHIDKNTPDRFSPTLSDHAGDKEDKTLPRITVAPELFGCIIGYARCESDFLFHVYYTDAKLKKDKFRGGYEICQLNFKHCIKPNRLMVGNVNESDEHWLVSYSEETKEYVPVKIGNCFISEIKYSAVTGALPMATYTLYLELHGRDSLNFSKNIKLLKGFYEIVLTIDKKTDFGSVYNEETISVTKITAGKYSKAKQLNAAMLSMESLNKPKYLNW